MKDKAFEELYDDEVNGETLDWKWDEDERVFRATDERMRVWVLRPTYGIIEQEDDESLEQEDEE